MQIYRGRVIVKGLAAGEALVSKEPVSFYGDVDPKTGVIVDEGNELYGRPVSGKVFIFPHGKGSTVGSYVIYRLSKEGRAPLAIINVETEPIIAVGCVLAKIPLIDRIPLDFMLTVKNGDFVEVDGYSGIIKINNRD